jgi:cell division protein FtsI/penicillin-binding protein 2
MAPGRGELVVFREQDVEARPGLNVVLTIDSGLQDIVESELAKAWTINTPVSITAIVVRPRTGEILALANLPNFDPNKPGGQMENLRNRAITDVAEPGSTFKIVVVSGALNEGIVDLTDPFDCENGVFHFMGYALHDTHHYGILNVGQIIAKSSNIGAAKVGIKMGAPRLYEYVHSFGFGEPTGIPLPGEQKGFAYPLERWTKLSISRIPMGYEVAVTPLQTVMAMSAIANGGRLMRPMLVNRLEDQEKNVVLKFEPQLIRQVIAPPTARKMVEALKLVVTEGTGAKARLEHYTVAGKTGTARKAGNGGYLVGKYFSSFIGFFPADDPELCISVVMDEPVVKKGYYGGETAAPVFKAIAERAAVYLGIRPTDDTPAEPLTTGVDTLAETPLNSPLTTAQTGRSF